MRSVKILSLAALAILLGGGLLFLFLSPRSRSEVPGSSLSERGKEFIAKERQAGNEFWTSQSLEDKGERVLGVQSVQTSCFSLELPFEVTISKLEDEGDGCSAVLRLLKHLTTIRIYTAVGGSPLKEIPGVALRLRETQVYTQGFTPPVNGQERLVFFEDSDGVAFIKTGVVLTTISISDATSKIDLEEKLDAVLKSIQIL